MIGGKRLSVPVTIGHRNVRPGCCNGHMAQKIQQLGICRVFVIDAANQIPQFAGIVPGPEPPNIVPLLPPDRKILKGRNHDGSHLPVVTDQVGVELICPTTKMFP